MAEKLRRATLKHVESELYAYIDTQKEILKLQNETEIGEGQATRLTNHKLLEQLQAIVDAIESVYDSLPEEKQRLIELKYWTKSKILTWEGIANNIPIHRATAIRWHNDIVQKVAKQIGWR